MIQRLTVASKDSDAGPKKCPGFLGAKGAPKTVARDVRPMASRCSEAGHHEDSPEGIQQSQQPATMPFRLALLAKYGGLWIDASTMCFKPFDEWIYNTISSDQTSVDVGAACQAL